MIKWRDEFKLGVPAIDEQHKRLFEIANQVAALMQNNLRLDKYDEIVATVEELKEYTVYHFSYEEEYMLSTGYKKFLSHKAEHADFVARIAEVDLREVDENQDEYLRATLDFVCNWIADHILVQDKLYVS